MSKKKLSKKEVQKIADLANIKLTDEELDKYSTELSSIIEYVDKLSEIDTEKIEMKAHNVTTQNVFRRDEPGKSLTQDEAISNRKSSSEGGNFVIKSTLK
ncbi:Asp-tRNA(Asn)/Glu-tRNA(Gln) amidotransferase subunit GatC [Candidatus Dojkabacteria bacterium]|nr:Asp-tRNA(Asn)/Glu-tRNA(Gln) amidotransferase subunit GatC [Candidatus Dojkabacteria bacterium]